MNIFKKLRQNSGFTLIELLVVIAIIAMLASVVLASLNTARQKGRDAKRIADLKQVQLALELHFDANSQYPAADAGNTIPGSLETNGYIQDIPVDPVAVQAYVYNRCTAVTDYCLAADLEDINNPVLDSDDDTVGVGCSCLTADGPGTAGWYNANP